jgi:ParB family chromosome partitioning protein
MQKGKITEKSGSRTVKRKKQVLGKGLDALIPEIEAADERSKDYTYCDIERIRPNRFQPRFHFHEDGLEDLSKAGLDQVPVVVKHVEDSKLLEISIVENIQRANFNPIEEAEAYNRLITEFNLTQDQAAMRVGKSRSAVANFLRLRQLPEQIKESIIDESLTMGHARALLGAENSAQQIAAWRAVVSKGLSVRETESLIRRLKNEKKKPKVGRKGSEDHYLISLAEDLARHFGTKVIIKRRGQQGKVEIEFYSNDDLDRLISRLKQTKF